LKTATLLARRRKSVPIAAASVIALATSLFTAELLDSAAPAHAAIPATTSSALSGTNAAIAAQVANASHPSGSGTVVLVKNSDGLLEGAAALAASINAPLLYATTSASADLSLPAAAGATNFILQGNPADFAAAYRADLATRGTVQNLTATDSSARFVAAAPLISGPKEVVVARSGATDKRGIQIASAYAIARGFPLLVISATDSAANIDAALEKFPGVPKTVVGEIAGLELPTLSAQAREKVTILSLDDAAAVAHRLVRASVYNGAAGNVLTAYPSGDTGSLRTSAALAARTAGGVALPYGVAPNGNFVGGVLEAHVQKWDTETRSLKLVANGATVTTANSILTASIGARLEDSDTQHGFAVTDVVPETFLNKPGFRISFTGIAGATAYSLRELDGTIISGTTTGPGGGALPLNTSVAMRGAARPASIEARTSTSVLGVLHFRPNDFTKTASAAFASISGSTHFAKIKSETLTPRTVLRYMTDPFADNPIPILEELAVTCLPYYIAKNMDTTKEWRYEFVDVADGNNASCTTTPSGAAPGLQTSSVTIPHTTGSFSAMRSEGSDAGNSVRPGPGATIIDALLSASIPPTDDITEPEYIEEIVPSDPGLEIAEEAELESYSTTEDLSSKENSTEDRSASDLTLSAVGDDWAPLQVRYQAYIWEEYLGFPGPSGDPIYSINAFGGDNRSFAQYDGSHRFRMDTTFYFGSNHHVDTVPDMGASHRYKCIEPWLATCILTASATAPNSELQWTSTSSGNTSGNATLRPAATNPLQFGAPAIDAELKIRLGTDYSSITGWHDAMPKHEIFIGIVPGDAYDIYTSYGNFVGCLVGELPGCTTYVNVGL
jgi:hypothetical protein